jgi:hypothetical protein
MKYLNYKIILLASTILITISCAENKQDYINHLEGYWEIESVMLQDGTKKDYTFSNTVDYISVNDSLTGFRKKLKPNFNGTFETSKNSEMFVLIFENDSLNMYYKTAFDSWKETVLNANENQLTVINKNGIIYKYKKYEPLNLN